MAVCSTLFRQIAVESGMFLYLLLSKQDAEVVYRKRLKMTLKYPQQFALGQIDVKTSLYQTQSLISCRLDSVHV